MTSLAEPRKSPSHIQSGVNEFLSPLDPQRALDISFARLSALCELIDIKAPNSIRVKLPFSYTLDPLQKIEEAARNRSRYEFQTDLAYGTLIPLFERELSRLSKTMEYLKDSEEKVDAAIEDLHHARKSFSKLQRQLAQPYSPADKRNLSIKCELISVAAEDLGAAREEKDKALNHAITNVKHSVRILETRVAEFKSSLSQYKLTDAELQFEIRQCSEILCGQSAIDNHASNFLAEQEKWKEFIEQLAKYLCMYTSKMPFLDATKKRFISSELELPIFNFDKAILSHPDGLDSFALSCRKRTLWMTYRVPNVWFTVAKVMTQEGYLLQPYDKNINHNSEKLRELAKDLKQIAAEDIRSNGELTTVSAKNLLDTSATLAYVSENLPEILKITRGSFGMLAALRLFFKMPKISKL